MKMQTRWPRGADDEAASIDIETDQLVPRASDKIMENRTSTLIARRLQTIAGADRIPHHDNVHRR